MCRKQALSDKEQSQLGVLAVSGVGKSVLIQRFAVSRQTVYTYQK